MTAGSGYLWREGDHFVELSRVGDDWTIIYGFEATGASPRRIVAQRTTPEYEDAVRQIWQVIGYYFAAPEHAERVRRDLLERAGLSAGEERYFPVPDPTYLTPAGGGASGAAQAADERERRARILRGEDEPPAPPAVPEQPATRRPWWKRFTR